MLAMNGPPQALAGLDFWCPGVDNITAQNKRSKMSICCPGGSLESPNTDLGMATMPRAPHGG